MRDVALGTRRDRDALRPLADAAFRDALATVAMPVTVVTTTGDRTPHGTTVSAFSSLSLDPPLVLVSLSEQSHLLGLLRRTKRFGVNVLASDQLELALRFATKDADKFGGAEWELADGLPRLAGCVAWAACEVQRLVRGGDHIVVFGLVVAAAHAPAAPLVHHGRRFATAVPL
jgi:flavin reductase (DIM6/NTAB) family NADH-FMN oxidoreductase RutF